jgi:hypothetical protein
MSTARFVSVMAVGTAVTAAAVLGSALEVPAGGPLYPNVVEEIPSHLHIQNDHQREWLRFSTTHINLGPGNLQIRGGGQIEPCTIGGVDVEQCTVATQEILDSDGAVVQTHPAGVAFFHPEHNTTTGTSPAWRCSRSPPATRPAAARGRTAARRS